MKRSLYRTVAAIAVMSVATMVSAQSERIQMLANTPFEQNRPTTEAARALMEELTFQRATQSYLWALPLLNTMGMRDGAAEAFGTGYNVMPIWTKRLDAKGNTLVVVRIDRLARSLSHLLEVIERLEGNGPAYHALTFARARSSLTPLTRGVSTRG